MSSLSTIPKGDSAWLLRKSIQRIIQQVSVLETNIGSSTTGNSNNTEIIFNDNGVLRGDADLIFNTALNKLVVNNIEVSTNATISGDLTVDTSTLKVDSANDRVGVGTASPTNKLSVTVTPPTADTDGLIINGPSSRQIIAGITGATYSYAGVGANQNLIYAGSGQLNILGDSQNVRIGTSASSYVTLDTSANFNVGGGNVVMATSGKGIDFSATTSGSGTMTSELLNDYEEGTFTPTVIGTTTDGTIGVYYAQTGRYTKVGRLVTVQVYLAWGSGTGTGDLAFAGLPFTNGSIPNNYASCTIGYFHDFALTASNVPSMYISPNSSRCDLYQFPIGGGSTTPVPYDVNAAIIFTATYFTA